MDYGFLGNGWYFDVSGDLVTGGGVGVSAQGQVLQAGGVDCVTQSIWMILSTALGERQGRADFGCGIYDLVFSPQSTTTETSIQTAVTEALSKWEPRITVLGITVAPYPNAVNGILVDIQYMINATNSRLNLVYPFFLST